MSLLPMPSAAELLAKREAMMAKRGQAAPVVPVPLPTASANPAYAQRRRGRMNRTEARYADYLAGEIAAGRVLWTRYEALRLVLAPRVTWTPDFPVILADGTLELREVKGAKGAGYYATEKARLKLRLATDAFPFRVVVVWPLAAGGWGREVQGESKLRGAA